MQSLVSLSLLLLLFLFLQVPDASANSTWNTLSGTEPLVIARGGSSILFPEQTIFSYFNTYLGGSLEKTVYYCDIQMSMDGLAICRPDVELNATTTVSDYAQITQTHNFYGKPVTGYFSMDFTYQTMQDFIGKQESLSRPGVFDGAPAFRIAAPEDMAYYLKSRDLWLNAEFPTFFAENNLSMATYVRKIFMDFPVAYISSPEVDFLKSIVEESRSRKTTVVFKISSLTQREPTSNVSYSDFLTNLTYVRSFADGIIIPKMEIWPVSPDKYYIKGPETDLVARAHQAGLKVFASGFACDNYPVPYNYSYDPVREFLQFTNFSAHVVDGFLTDCPITASEAIACFSGNSSTTPKFASMPFVISSNGASGDYPGCTEIAYQEAVKSGANFIDCTVQMTMDGIPICRESANLLSNTDISSYPDLLSNLTKNPQYNETGIFTFNLTLERINTLRAKISNPFESSNFSRNPEYNGIYNIWTLQDFLIYAKNITNLNIFINIQKGYIMEHEMGIQVIGPVLSVINTVGLNNSSRVWIQSEDIAVLHRLKILTPYNLVYKVARDRSVPPEVIEKIKPFARAVNLHMLTATYMDEHGFLTNASDLVYQFHLHNISVFLNGVFNEQVSIPFDYEADPYLELNTLTEILKVEGFITAFPATATRYLNSVCRTNDSSYKFSLIEPGLILTQAGLPISTTIPELPILNIDQADLPPTIIPVQLNPYHSPPAAPPLVKIFNGTSPASASTSAPSPNPSSGIRTSPFFSLLAFSLTPPFIFMLLG